MSDEMLSEEEIGRLQVIADLGLTSSEVDAYLAQVTSQAAESLSLPIACVSIVMDQAQYFAASHGLGGWIEQARGTPVEWAFCKFAVEAKDTFVVEDAAKHPLVANNPLVVEEGIRCYLGVPLISRGHVLGTLCVIGTESRDFGEDDIARLKAFATDAMAHIEQRAASRASD